MMRDQRALLLHRFRTPLASSLVALLLSLAFRPVIEHIIFVFFFGALFFSTYRGGFVAGLVVVTFGALASNYFLIPPFETWKLEPLVLLRIAFFVTIGLVAAWFSEKRLRAEARALKALSEAGRSRAELEAVFEAVTEGIAVCDMQGEFVFMNAAEARMNGYATADEMRRDIAYFASVYELKRPDGQLLPVEEWPISRVMRGESLVDCEVLGRRRDTGQEWTFSFSGEPVRDASGRQILSVVVTRDVTAHKRRERALEVSEERFRTMADNIPQLAWMAGGDGALTWYNRRWFDFTGSTLEEMLGSGWQKVHHPEHVARVTTKFRAHVVSGQPWEDTFPLRRHDGVYRWFLSRAVPVRDEEGRVVRWFGSNTDVTEQQEAEQMLVRQAEELEQFAYVASHDLKEPLRKASSYAQLLQSKYGGQLDDDGHRYLNYIQEGTVRMKTLIEDLLSYSAASRSARVWAPVDLRAVALEALSDLQSVVDLERARVIIDPLPTVNGNATQLRRLFQNLLANALKFHGKGTPDVQISSQIAGGEVEVAVRDNGIGIAPEYHEAIFKMFRRLHTAQQYPGTGIGLAVCRRILEVHGGRIRVESTDGGGATFLFTLPLEAAVAAKR